MKKGVIVYNKTMDKYLFVFGIRGDLVYCSWMEKNDFVLYPFDYKDLELVNV